MVVRGSICFTHNGIFQHFKPSKPKTFPNSIIFKIVICFVRVCFSLLQFVSKMIQYMYLRQSEGALKSRKKCKLLDVYIYLWFFFWLVLLSVYYLHGQDGGWHCVEERDGGRVTDGAAAGLLPNADAVHLVGQVGS